jgi:DNA-binding winged helix-turn-helix (wHTH) protein/tetratricopeptide (TPR) repeat protein
MRAPEGTAMLGRALFEPARGLIRRPDGVETALRPKTLELLEYLLERPGQLVSRNEIFEALWPGLFVTDDSITQCVVELRRALGPDAGILKTVTKRGYMLDIPAPVAPAPASPESPHSNHAGVPIVAVVPFRLGVEDSRLACLADGVLEGVVEALTMMREPMVISANSTRPLAREAIDPSEIARRFGAQYVTSGSLRAAGRGLRLAVELAPADTPTVLWRQTFELDGEVTTEVEDRLASVIARTLVPRVADAELRRKRRGPESVDAYFLMIEARRLIFRMERAALEEARGLLRRAVAIDPDYPPLHALMADVHSLLLGQGWSTDRQADLRAMREAAETALELEPRQARALALLGHNRTIHERDFDAALDMFERAIDVAPNDAETWMWSVPTFAYMGNAEEAIRRGDFALRLSPEDPLLFRYQHFLSIAHYVAGDLEGAVTWAEKSFRRNPRYTSNLRTLAAALSGLGRFEEARDVARRVLELEPGFRVGPMVARYAARRPEVRELYGRRLVEAGLPP